MDEKDFMWRDRTGHMHYLQSMQTSHVYNTWVMVWNHLVPQCDVVPAIGVYSFSSFYTKEYMLVAERLLYQELRKRITGSTKHPVKYWRYLEAADNYVDFLGGKRVPYVSLVNSLGRSSAMLRWINLNVAPKWCRYASMEDHSFQDRWEGFQLYLEGVGR